MSYGMNLNLINQQAIEAHTPYVDVQIYLYKGTTFDQGINTPVYYSPINATANIQLYNDQKLTFEINATTTQVYKKFFINYSLSGVNRDLSTGGDFISYVDPLTNKTLKYRIVRIINKFPADNLGNIGYTECVGVESEFPND